MIKTAKFILPLLILAFSIVGCGGGKKPSTVKVSGVLKIGGEPAGEGINVALSPTSPDSGLQSASARTTEGGKITFFTGDTGTAGVMPGEYTVVVVDSGGDGSYMDAGNIEEGADGSTNAPKTSEKIPEKYTNNKTSDLKVTIDKADSSFEINVPLE